MPNPGSGARNLMELRPAMKRVDFVIQYLYRHADQIANAHENFEIPLEELFRIAVVKAITSRAIDTHEPEPEDDSNVQKSN